MQNRTKSNIDSVLSIRCGADNVSTLRSNENQQRLSLEETFISLEVKVNLLPELVDNVLVQEIEIPLSDNNPVLPKLIDLDLVESIISNEPDKVVYLTTQGQSILSEFNKEKLILQESNNQLVAFLQVLVSLGVINTLSFELKGLKKKMRVKSSKSSLKPEYNIKELWLDHYRPGLVIHDNYQWKMGQIWYWR